MKVIIVCSHNHSPSVPSGISDRSTEVAGLFAGGGTESDERLTD